MSIKNSFDRNFCAFFNKLAISLVIYFISLILILSLVMGNIVDVIAYVYIFYVIPLLIICVIFFALLITTIRGLTNRNIIPIKCSLYSLFLFISVILTVLYLNKMPIHLQNIIMYLISLQS